MIRVRAGIVRICAMACCIVMASHVRVAAAMQRGDKALLVGISGSGEVDAVQAEVGVEAWGEEWVSAVVGLALFGSSDTDLHGGVDLKLRFSPRAPVSPFVGVGLFMGWWTETYDVASDGRDNDNDWLVDEWDEEREETTFLGAIYPEAGVHWWCTESTRLSLFARYYLTTAGRDADRTLYGIAASFGL